MNNPFEEIKSQLTKIENDLRELKAAKSPQPKKESDFVDVIAAAKILNLSKNTVYQMTFKKKLPYYKTGKHLYFKESELIAYIEKGQRVISNN